MLCLPPNVGTRATGQRRGSLGPGTGVKSWGDTTSELREHPETHVQTNQVGLPEADHSGPILKEGQSARVFKVHIHAPGGGAVRLVVQPPIVCMDASPERLFKGEMGLHPGDPSKLDSVSVYDRPEVAMLPRRQGVGMEKSLKTIGHITAIGKDMDPAWGAGEGLGGRSHLGPLSGLPGSMNGPFNAQGGEV